MSEGKILLFVSFIVTVGAFLAVGPARCGRNISSWKASAYGSDWLVVQYAHTGEAINVWELKGKSVGNENQSDGIFFNDKDDNVVHLSGNYIFVEVNSDFTSTREKYIKKDKR